MLSVWVSVKENMKCRSKRTDVAVTPWSRTLQFKDKVDDSATNKTRTPRSRLMLDQAEESIPHNMDVKKSFEKTMLSELACGDPSRSIIERIIEASIPKDSKNHQKIMRVFRVINPSEILDRFEKYREMVKKMAYLQYRSHPRNLVDGNELLLFYGTTISCCNKKRRPTELVTELCNEPNCRVCRALGLKFDMEHTRKHGIRLSRSSEALSERVIGSSKGRGVKRAVIVCRTIAGTKCGVNDLIRSAPGNSSGDIIVQNPNAVLPCFVIVFGCTISHK